MKKKLICIALSSAMAVSSFGLVYADENSSGNSVVQEQETTTDDSNSTGDCGENVTYSLDSDGVLTVSGS